MGQVVLWALGTGFVTGAVWFGILLFRRHPRVESPALPAEKMERRLQQLEERLDATEHVLMRDRIEKPRT